MTNPSNISHDSSPSMSADGVRPPLSAAASTRRRMCRLWCWGGMGLLLVAMLAGGFFVSQKIQRIEKRLVELQQQDEKTAIEANVKSQQANDVEHRLEVDVAQLASQLADTRNRQQAFDNFYQEFTRNRESWTFVEIRRILSATNEQLRLTGNVPLALFALKGATTRLATFDSINARAARKAIEQDIHRLQATPAVDFAKLAGLLDDAVMQVDHLPLAGEPAPAFPTTANAVADEQSHWQANWEQFKRGFVKQLASFIQVRQIDNADAMRIAPEASYFVRENLKLRLLSARLSLLSRNAATLKTDIALTKKAIARYFDPVSPRTQSMLNLISQVEAAPQTLELPDLSASLQALRQE